MQILWLFSLVYFQNSTRMRQLSMWLNRQRPQYETATARLARCFSCLLRIKALMKSRSRFSSSCQLKCRFWTFSWKSLNCFTILHARPKYNNKHLMIFKRCLHNEAMVHVAWTKKIEFWFVSNAHQFATRTWYRTAIEIKWWWWSSN